MVNRLNEAKIAKKLPIGGTSLPAEVRNGPSGKDTF
jgi:hypothetical protein